MRARGEQKQRQIVTKRLYSGRQDVYAWECGCPFHKKSSVPVTACTKTAMFQASDEDWDAESRKTLQALRAWAVQARVCPLGMRLVLAADFLSSRRGGFSLGGFFSSPEAFVKLPPLQE